MSLVQIDGKTMSSIRPASARTGLLVCAGLLCSVAAAQQNTLSGLSCEQINQPARSGFDFTESISRWGSTDSFNIDASPYTVRNVSVNQLPIFDESNPDENNSLYRWINRIHIDTKPGVIRNKVLFEPGDTVNSRILAESERLLRDQKYVSESKLRVLQKCDDVLDVEVVTREVWTMTPDLSIHTAGGDNKFKIGVRDTNFLGTGQNVGINYNSTAERTAYEIAFEDEDFRDRHRLLKLVYSDNSDGSRYWVQLAQPFYALDSRRAWNFKLENTNEIMTQYQFGDKVSEVDHSYESAEMSWGFSGGIKNRVTRRYTLGLRHEQHSYGPGTELPLPGVKIEDVSLDYPFLQFERIEDNFATAYNISQIYRTEDLQVGSALSASIGYSPRDAGFLIMDGRYSDTLIFRPKMLLQWNTDWYARLNTNTSQWEDSRINFNVDFHRGQTEHRTLYMGLAATRALNLNSSEQIYLGGTNGLRGYDSHFLNGDSAVRFSIEQRLFTDYHPWQLLRVGFAGFFDVGRVYGSTDPAGNDLYKNVGLGLRLAPSKSDKGNIIHADIAWPLNRNSPGGNSPQFILELKGSF